MDELFESKNEVNLYAPLAERMRPKTIDEMFGQKHLIGDDGNIRKFLNSDFLPSIIFWGPPGTGKTTLALILAQHLDMEFIRMSAIESGVKDLRQNLEKAEINQKRNKKTLLFIDEIHRFNKSQQDALLHAVEKGIVTLIGATTENPSFEVNAALISRSQVYTLKQLDIDDIKEIVNRALKDDPILQKKEIDIIDIDFLIDISGGDARSALNALELAVNSKKGNKIKISNKDLENALQRRVAKYDKKGENHYDTISAFIKSMRGSDPDASIFWLAKMLDAGEDPKFIARRMLIFASEDIGNADPSALSLAVSVFDAVNLIGMPECRINLAQGVTYLASTAKSNASYKAIDSALADIRKGVDVSVPIHLRNAPTKLMKEEGYGKDYKYPHDQPGSFIVENYFPEKLGSKHYYKATENGREAKIKERLEKMWGRGTE